MSPSCVAGSLDVPRSIADTTPGFRQMSAEEQVQAFQQANVESLQRSLQHASQADEAASNTMVQLDTQRGALSS